MFESELYCMQHGVLTESPLESMSSGLRRALCETSESRSVTIE